MLGVGLKFPEFALPNQDGKTTHLKDYAGKWLVLYVYPKDDTPGCTIQAKSFTAMKEEFAKANIVVVGISADDVESHKNFCSKYSMTIDLLSDSKGELLKRADVKQTEWKAQWYWERSTFVINPDGVVAKTYENVKPDGHEQMLLTDIKKLQSQPARVRH